MTRIEWAGWLVGAEGRIDRVVRRVDRVVDRFDRG